ncbi:N(2)-fixation sustaining protein CowN [Billgrantia endophytica]|uniref:N(2)-fixation sustaining protein CowN n=1 Tax=Billgrantia endophytica TaxID=2033802 RepID=A0A2N7UEI9_9GAMM|nr:N(2)-fixation sustaining protein CowN [Halomonas endophytica]PMR78830.1 N(2)-fixation sustaining protein CowN [Halomonas endophytica]
MSFNNDENATIDRYVTFKGIDCDGNAARIMAIIEKHAADPRYASPFWDYFLNKRHPKSGPKPDDLFLIHTNINQIYEFFEECEDAEALNMLTWLEENCC